MDSRPRSSCKALTSQRHPRVSSSYFLGPASAGPAPIKFGTRGVARPRPKLRGVLESNAMGFMYTATVYVAGYLIVMFVAICLACGLYFLAELAEEHTRLTGKIVGSSIVLVRDPPPRLHDRIETVSSQYVATRAHTL